MQKEQSLDWLAEKVINAFSKDNDPGWVEQKKRELQGMDRLKVLRSLSSLDQLNLTAVCEQIGVSPDEMQVTLGVLKKI